MRMRLKNLSIIVKSIILMIFIVIIVGGVFIFSSWKENKENENDMNLIIKSIKEEKCLIEYGNKISKDKKDWFPIEDKNLLEDMNFEMNVENEKDKEYPAVGKYIGTIEYKSLIYEFKVEVKDTIAPVFSKFTDEIEYEIGDEEIDYNEYFKAEDLSLKEIVFEDGKIDFSKEGKYELIVVAKDKHGNEIEKIATINVTRKEDVNVSINQGIQQNQNINNSGSSTNSHSNSGSGSSYVPGWRDPKTLRHSWDIDPETGKKIEGSDSWTDESGNVYDQYGYPTGRNIWDW